MNRRTRCCPAFLASACLVASLSGCGRQSAVMNVAPPAPAAVRVAPDEGEKGKQASSDAGKAKDAAPDPARPADRGAKLVDAFLKPSEQAFADAARQARGPLALPGLPALERPQLPLPTVAGDLPRTPLKRANPSLRMGALPEGLPLARYRDDPPAPRREELPSVGLIRLPSPDLDAPVPLPILAAPVADRAPLGDPTPEVSLAAVLAQPVPMRTSPAPFVRLNLPDPFEHAQAVRLRTPPAEDPTPPIASPRPPVK
jgi:hypothetical protein